LAAAESAAIGDYDVGDPTITMGFGSVTTAQEGYPPYGSASCNTAISNVVNASFNNVFSPSVKIYLGSGDEIGNNYGQFSPRTWDAQGTAAVENQWVLVDTIGYTPYPTEATVFTAPCPTNFATPPGPGPNSVYKGFGIMPSGSFAGVITFAGFSMV